MTVLRRLDAVLELTKKQVLDNAPVKFVVLFLGKGVHKVIDRKRLSRQAVLHLTRARAWNGNSVSLSLA